MNTTQPELPPNPEAGAQQQAATPAPAAGEMGGPIRGKLSHLISWLTEASCQAANAGRSTDAGMLCWAAQVVSERVDEDAPAPPAPADPTKMAAPPAEGELVDLADAVMSWVELLDEGTPEERLLGRVAYVLRQRQAPPHEGEVDALIKVLSRIARMFDFMPDGPPNGLIIHRAIELLRQLTPPAEGEDLATSLQNCGTWLIEIGYASEQVNTRDMGIKVARAAALLQQQAAELAVLRQLAEEMRLSWRSCGRWLARWRSQVRTTTTTWVPHPAEPALPLPSVEASND